MTTYFLSYSRQDEELALRFAFDLMAEGVSMWVDQYDIQPAQHWDRAVEAALRGCGGVIVLLSPASVASSNVADEVSVGLDAAKNIIPVMIAPCTLPLRLTRMQYIDASKDYKAAVRRCLAVIGGAADLARRNPMDEAPSPLLTMEVLTEATRRLAGFVGSNARDLVRAAAATAATPADLYQALAESISSPSEREAFLGWVDSPPPPPPPAPAPVPLPTAPAASAPSAVGASELAAITKALTRHIGPIAAHLVKRENTAGRTREDLCRTVAARIPSGEDRAAFLKEMRLG